MGLVEELGVKPGITTIIGSGGKTTLMERLARELAESLGGHGAVGTSGASGATGALGRGDSAATGILPRTIALATTTRVLPPVGFPLLANLSAAQVASCLPALGVAYVGSVRETAGVRKLGAPLWVGMGKEVAAELDTHATASANSSSSVNTSTSAGISTSMNSPIGADISTGMNVPTGTATLISSHAVASADAPIYTYARNGARRENAVASIERLARLATYTLVEADGSHHLPLKAHASWEPVVPTGARTILVVGAFGFGQPVEKVVHRPELFCERMGCSPSDLATPELVAQEICSELQEGLISFDVVLVNGRNSAGDASVRAFEHALRAGGATCKILAP